MQSRKSAHVAAGISTVSTDSPNSGPPCISSAVSALQKAMWIMVSATGNGKPAYESTYLLKSMTVADSEIQVAMSR
jgi:formiminotetrahydrofolate cyclodeaminase